MNFMYLSIFVLLFLFIYLTCCMSLLYIFSSSSLIMEMFLFESNGFEMTFSLIFDYISLSFFCSISFISMNVFLYSIFYMKGEKNNNRFFLLTFLFVISMFLLVFSGNFFVTMLGWDGLGITSFCLVVFYQNSSSMNSGLLTFFTNRIGDSFFIISFIFFYSNMSITWDFFSYSYHTIFVSFIILGSITKSAQLPFAAWLPAAMAAPTPISSLVHSSTLVTAGVYVLIRFNFIFCNSFIMMKILFLLTMMISGICAFLEVDLKKIIAMSTLSQLSLMLFVLSLGIWKLAFLHMIIHSFFKSMLFLSAGSIILNKEGCQDSRQFGGSLFSFSSFIFFVVSTLCLSGFPFLIGFYSKDFIIMSSAYLSGLLLYYIFMISCMFTILYSMRLIFETYYKFNESVSHLAEAESPYFFFAALCLFFKCWLISGAFYWMILIDMNFFFSTFDLLIGMLSMLMSIIFFKVANFHKTIIFSSGMLFFSRWFFTSCATYLFNKNCVDSFEKTWFEIMGGKGVYSNFLNLNKKFYMIENIKLGFILLIFFLLLLYL